jgi:hypothetical protein
VLIGLDLLFSIEIGLSVKPDTIWLSTPDGKDDVGSGGGGGALGEAGSSTRDFGSTREL